jgi:hypothetical protein
MNQHFQNERNSMIDSRKLEGLNSVTDITMDDRLTNRLSPAPSANSSVYIDKSVRLSMERKDLPRIKPVWDINGRRIKQYEFVTGTESVGQHLVDRSRSRTKSKSKTRLNKNIGMKARSKSGTFVQNSKIRNGFKK